MQKPKYDSTMAHTSGIVNHRWDLKPSEALQLQQELRAKVIIQPFNRPIKYIGGADISYNKGSLELYAGIVVLEYESQEVVAWSTVVQQSTFPYIPGLLSFRELPPLMAAWRRIPLIPDVMMTDSQGIAHPRRMGEACHFGLLTGIASIGCAKKNLMGHYDAPKPERGSYSPIRHREETLGYALCTKDKVKPVFISPGYAISLEESREVALHCARGYKIPEPTRQAHLLVNRLRMGAISAGTWQKESEGA